MSLINTMLNDLDARQASRDAPGDDPLAELHPTRDAGSTHPRRPVRLKMAILLLLSSSVLALSRYPDSIPEGALPESLALSRAGAPVAVLPPRRASAVLDTVPDPGESATAVGGGPDGQREAPRGVVEDVVARAASEVHPATPESADHDSAPAARLKLALSLGGMGATALESSVTDAALDMHGDTSLESVDAAHVNGDTTVILRLSRAPQYVLYTLRDPPRAVVELEHTALDETAALALEPTGLLNGVRTRRLPSGALLVIFDLASAADMDGTNLMAGEGPANELIIHLVPAASSAGTGPVAKREEPRPATVEDSPPRVRPVALKTTPATPADDADSHYAKARIAYEAGRVATAEQHLRTALELDPRQVRARYLLASLWVARKRPLEAVALLAEGLRLDPAHTDLARLYARIELDAGRVAEAIRVLESSRTHGRTDADYDAFLAALLQRVGRHDEAVRLYRAVLAGQPENGVWWTGLGISLEAMNHAGEARSAYQAARGTASLSSGLRRYIDERLAAIGQREDS